jgi:hypothetical protein
MGRSNIEELKSANVCQNIQTACKVTNTVPKMKKVQQNRSQLSQSSSLQNQSGSHSKHSTQCSHHSQEHGHVCKNKDKLTQDSNIQQDAITQKTGVQSQSSQTALSQPGPELSLKQRLLWLQKRRDVGLWVQCSRLECKKWRFLHNIRDPVEIPQEWFCHMNSGNFFAIYVIILDEGQVTNYGKTCTVRQAPMQWVSNSHSLVH